MRKGRFFTSLINKAESCLQDFECTAASHAPVTLPTLFYKELYPFRRDITLGMHYNSRHGVIHGRLWRCKCLSTPLSRETTGPRLFFPRYPSFYLALLTALFVALFSFFSRLLAALPAGESATDELAGTVNHGILVGVDSFASRRVPDRH